MAMREAAAPARAPRRPAVLAWAVAGLTVLTVVPAYRLVSLTWLAGVGGAPPQLATVGPSRSPC